MKRTLATIGLLLAAGGISTLLAAGCSSSSGGGQATGDDSGTDATGGSSSGGSSSGGSSSGGSSSGGSSSGGSSSGGSSSGGNSSGGSSSGGTTDAGADADAAACTGSWLVAPTVTGLLPDGGMVVLHALGSGTQDYACIGTAIDGGADAGDAGESFAWVLQGPDAELKDCNGNTIGHHFPSEAGASAPEWQTTDGTYVIGRKLAALTPDGGSGSIPWLLLGATSNGGTGTLSTVTFVQRLDTDGGLAPSTGCDYTTEAGATVNVPYTADYYFYGP